MRKIKISFFLVQLAKLGLKTSSRNLRASTFYSPSDIYLSNFCSFALGNLIITARHPKAKRVSTQFYQVDTLKKCQALPDYPLAVNGASGAFVDGFVLVCGGNFATGTYSNKCFKLGPQKIWEESITMSAPRQGAAMVNIMGRAMMFGGYSGRNYLDSTEILDVRSETTKPGPKLPAKMHNACAVKLNATTTLLTGGYDGSGHLKSTFYYTAQDQTFKTGPQLIQGRSRHACGILTQGEKQFLIVAGGVGQSTEVLSLDDQTQWKTGLYLTNIISFRIKL